MRGANLLGRWTHRISERFRLSLQTYYDWTELSDAVPALVLDGMQFAPAGRLQDDLQYLRPGLPASLSPGQPRSGIVWGAGLRHTHDVVSNAPALAFLPARLNQQLYSAFLQDEILLRENFSLTLGTKLEHNDYTGLEVEPNLRLQWQPAARPHGLGSRFARGPHPVAH